MIKLSCLVLWSVLCSCSLLPAKSVVEFATNANALADEIVAELDVVVQSLPPAVAPALPYWAELKADVKRVETAFLDPLRHHTPHESNHTSF